MILKISTEKKLKKKGSLQMGNGMGEHVERDSLIVLDDVSGFADRSPSFVTFLTTSVSRNGNKQSKMEGHTFSNSDILYIFISYGRGYKLPY